MIICFIKRFVKNYRIHPRMIFQAAIENVPYATFATGGIITRNDIGTKLGLRTEWSDDAREGYGTKTGVGTGVGFGIESNRKNFVGKRRKPGKVLVQVQIFAQCLELVLDLVKAWVVITHFYWMLVKVQWQDQMREQVWILIWIQARTLLAPLVVNRVKAEVGKFD